MQLPQKQSQPPIIKFDDDAKKIDAIVRSIDELWKEFLALKKYINNLPGAVAFLDQNGTGQNGKDGIPTTVVDTDTVDLTLNQNDRSLSAQTIGLTGTITFVE